MSGTQGSYRLPEPPLYQRTGVSEAALEAVRAAQTRQQAEAVARRQREDVELEAVREQQRLRAATDELEAYRESARRRYELAGGSPSDFTAAWPGIKAEYLKQRATDDLVDREVEVLKQRHERVF